MEEEEYIFLRFPQPPRHLRPYLAPFGSCVWERLREEEGIGTRKRPEAPSASLAFLPRRKERGVASEMAPASSLNWPLGAAAHRFPGFPLVFVGHRFHQGKALLLELAKKGNAKWPEMRCPPSTRQVSSTFPLPRCPIDQDDQGNNP